MKTVLLRNLTVRKDRKFIGKSGSRNGFVFMCVFFPPKKRLKHSLISEVKRGEKEEEVEVEDLGGQMFVEERPQKRPGRDNIQSIGSYQGMLEKRGQSYSSRKDGEKSKDRCK